jgi:hypothetical protein
MVDSKFEGICQDRQSKGWRSGRSHWECADALPGVEGETDLLISLFEPMILK